MNEARPTLQKTAIGIEGLEEYVSDCVIVLDNRVEEQVSSRRLHIVKYRGSSHGSNEYPFLIDDQGLSLLPITAINLNQEISNERITSGVEAVEHTDAGISSLMDAWILLRNHEGAHARLRTLTILKSRGMAHLADVRRFLITDQSVTLGEPFAPGGQP